MPSFTPLFSRRLALLSGLLAGLLALPAEAMYYHCRNADGSDTYVHHSCGAGQQLLGMSAYLPGHEPPPPKPQDAPAPKHAAVAAPVDATTASPDGHDNVVYGGFHPDTASTATAQGGGQGGGGGGQGWSPGDPTTPRAYRGDSGSWLKQFFTKVYGKRCSDAVERTHIMAQWTPTDAETFCHCVGANVYDSSMNFDGLKQAVSTHGQSLQGAANTAGEQCVNGPAVPKWQSSN